MRVFASILFKNTQNFNLPTSLLLCTLSMLFTANSQAQSYLGAGIHLTPPMSLSPRKNPYVSIRPHLGAAWSLTYKKERKRKDGIIGYWEAGMTTQSLHYNLQENVTDSLLSYWGDERYFDIGAVSILYGVGRQFAIGNRGNAFCVGLESSVKIVQVSTGTENKSFGFKGDGIIKEGIVFPIYLRLGLGYQHPIHFGKYLPGYLLFYANLSPQNIQKGAHFIRNPVDNAKEYGHYKINNSDLGIKLFVGLEKGEAREQHRSAKTQRKLLALKDKQVKFRLALGGQLYLPAQPRFYNPKLDSLFLSGKKFAPLPQFAITAEFPFRKYQLWSAAAGLGFGKMEHTLVFKSGVSFPENHVAVSHSQSIKTGNYVQATLGLSRRAALGNLEFAHTLSASGVFLFNTGRQYLGVPLNTGSVQTPPFENAILKGWVDSGFYTILYGGEYNPEMVFGLGKRYFMALGLVFNYSFDLVNYSEFQIFNNKTTYYGTMHQGFSKIGLTARVGLER